ncbi:MAG: CoA-disulfide reductase [Solirubrobacterales bacterium 70-9]|nr:MAG: CoA-disulfide reductase [Solirubrobacterales bacterium 70-9]
MRLVALGGSDAGISAALRARELDPAVEATVVVADAFPNFSICGIPYYVSGDVGDWRELAHRTVDDLEAAGIELRLGTTVAEIDPRGHRIMAEGGETIDYDALVIGTGSVPMSPPIDGLDRLGPAEGVHLLHSIGDTFELMRTLDGPLVRRAVIVGAGYIGLELAEALVTRGLEVTQIEQLPEVLPTVDPDLGALIREELARNGVDVRCGTRVESVAAAPEEVDGRLMVRASGPAGDSSSFPADLVLVAVGVRPEVEVAASAGVELGVKGAIAVDRRMRTNIPGVFAAGDCAVTHHRLLGTTYLPLGTTAHKQGRVAGENAVGGTRDFAGILGTQVVKVFDLVAARTGLRDHEATAAGLEPETVSVSADDHKAYYPGARTVEMRLTGDLRDGRLLGVQMVGGRTSEIAMRIDIPATAIFNEMNADQLSDLDLSYTPPFGSPWDPVQAGTQELTRQIEGSRRSHPMAH